MADQDLAVNLIGRDISASSALQNLARAASQAARSAGDSMDAMNRRVAESSNQSVRASTSGFGSGLMSWAASGLAGVLGGVTASITNTVTNALGDAGQAIFSTLKSTVVDFNSQLEMANIGFTTMLGSGKEAQAFLSDLQNFAKTTPFEFGDLTSYAQQMIGYGIAAKNVIPYLTALGDAAAGSGKSSEDLGNAVLAFEQMAARGKVDLGDLNQLTNAGIPALSILASKYGVSTGALLKMISAGKIASSDALPKLIKGIESGTKSTAAFGGMMQKQSGTFTGAMSNIQDALNITLSKAFKPFYQVLERGAIAVSKFVQTKQFSKFASDVGKTVMDAGKQIGRALNQIFSDPKVAASMRSLGTSIGKIFQSIGPALRAVLPGLVRFAQAVLPELAHAASNVAKAMPTLIAWWGRLSNALGKAGPGIARVIHFLTDLGKSLFDVSAKIGNFAATAASRIAQFSAKVQGVMNGLPGFFTRIGGQMIQGLINGFNAMFGQAIANVQANVGRLAAAARSVLGIHSPSRVFHEIGQQTGQGLANGIAASIGGVASAGERMAVATIASASRRLGALSEQRKRVQAELAKTKEALSAAKSDRTQLKTDLITSTTGAADITKSDTTGGMVQNLADMVQRARQFKTDLQSLARIGIDKVSFKQLVAGWQSDPAAALSAADQLIANPMDLKEIGTLQRQLSSAASSLGSYASGNEYNATVSSKSAKQRREERRVKSLTGQMNRVAAVGNAAAKRGDIHIHLTGHYTGTKDELAKTVTSAIKDAVKKGQLPKNVLTAL